MLATAGTPGRGEWIAEPKLDGWRALVYLDSGLCVRTHTGRIVTENVPELAALAAELPGDTVLDGELVAGQEPSGNDENQQVMICAGQTADPRVTAGRRIALISTKR